MEMNLHDIFKQTLNNLDSDSVAVLEKIAEAIEKKEEKQQTPPNNKPR